MPMNVTTYRRPPSAMQGFSLVEMMIALVAGMIVVAAVIALIVSMLRSNQQNIQATRLTQELRATTAVIATDLKRARGVQDPMWWGKKGGTTWQNIRVLSSGKCIAFGYEGAAGGGFHVIRVNSGKVELGSAAAMPTTCTATTWKTLSSNYVNIVDAQVFSPPDGIYAGREITITLTGSLTSGDSDIAAIRRTLSQTVFVRSLAGS